MAKIGSNNNVYCGRCLKIVFPLAVALISLAFVNKPANDPRKGAKIELMLDKQQFFLGENILLHYGVTNQGTEPFGIETGHDYRGAPRHLRFKVIAIDDKGIQVEDPYPSTMCMGGLGGEETLQPGQSWWTSLPLMRYCDFQQPGLYTLKVYHDLGWDKPDYWKQIQENTLPQDTHIAPIVETTIKLTMPSRKQAQQVMEDLLTLPKDPYAVHGKRIAEYADFTSVRYPVYLPIVSKMAEEGDQRGLEAIGSMVTPEATRMLIQLLDSQHENISTNAMRLLFQRLPIPQTQKNIWGWGMRQRIVSRSWHTSMKPVVLKYGWDLLGRSDRESLMNGAYIIRCLGTKKDLTQFIKFLDRGLILMKDDPVEQDKYLRPATASESLIDAGWELIERGSEVPTDVRTPGRVVLYMLALGKHENFRPANWQDNTLALLKHPIPFVRAVVLENLPAMLSSAQLDTIATLIEDDYVPVQAAACNLAAKIKSEQFHECLLAVLQETKNTWLLRAAHDAATACGVTRDRLLEICVERLANDDLATTLFDLMITIVEREGGYGYSNVDWSMANDLKSKWKLLIEKNRDRIRKGPLFKIAEPPLTSDLFPPGFSFCRKDNEPWPRWPQRELPFKLPTD